MIFYNKIHTLISLSDSKKIRNKPISNLNTYYAILGFQTADCSIFTDSFQQLSAVKPTVEFPSSSPQKHHYQHQISSMVNTSILSDLYVYCLPAVTDVFLLVKSFLRQMGIECWVAERNCVPCIFNCLAYVSEKRMLLHRLKLSHKRSNTAWTKLILCVVSCLLSIKCGQRPEEANLQCSSSS